MAVFERIEATLKPALPPLPPYEIATDGYVPIVLPAVYHVTDQAGQISTANYPGDPQPPRFAESRKVWNLVWCRRIVYFLTMFASVLLLSVPLLDRPTLGADSPLVLLRPLIALAGAFLPSMLAPWLEAYSAAPGYLVLGGAVVLVLLALGGWLQQKIRDEMRAIWIRRPAPAGWGDSIAFWIRTQPAYRIFFYWLKHQGLPSLFAILILWAIIALVSQLVFRTRDALGAFCVSDAAGPSDQAGAPIAFQTNNACMPTRVHVLKDEDYRVTIKVTDDWFDSSIKTDPLGFSREKMSWVMYPALPFRRIVFAKWYTPVLRVGSKGGEEHVLDLKPVPPGQAVSYEDRFKPHSDGEVFIFVNDAVWGLPKISRINYENNRGSASVSIEHLGINSRR
jgi:hypothetical protein